jgi:hypothetical protein
MRIQKLAIGALGLIFSLTLLPGCGAQPGTTILTQGANADPVMAAAPKTGEYMLFTAASPNPTATIQLKEGDALGFKKGGDDGHWIGVAGSSNFDLPKGTAQAYWKVEQSNK